MSAGQNVVTPLLLSTAVNLVQCSEPVGHCIVHSVVDAIVRPASIHTQYSVICISCIIYNQWRNKFRSQQHEREKELGDHAVVIKELQKVIGDERIAKEQLDNQVSIEPFSYLFMYELSKLKGCSLCMAFFK